MKKKTKNKKLNYNDQPVEYDENLQFIDFIKYYEKLKK